MSGKETKRDELIDTAQEIFFKFGVRKTTVDDIAQAAGMTKSSLYHYFSGKEDIVRAVASKTLEANLEQFRIAIQKKHSLYDSLKHFIDVVLERHIEMHQYFISSIEEVLELIPMLRDLVGVYKKEVQDIIRARLRKAIEDGEVTNLPEEEMSSILMMLIHHRAEQCCDESLSQVASSDPDTMLKILLSPYLKSD